VQHEALINDAVAGKPATILCPYDATGLDPDVLADAAATHPVLVVGGRREPSLHYAEPAITVAAFNQPFAEPDGAVTAMDFTADSLPDVRRAAAQQAVLAGLRAERALALQIAVHEMAVNTVEHTSDGGRLRIWRERDDVVCEIADGGTLADPLAGRRSPPTSLDGVRGLLLVHVLCDLVQVYSRVGATTIRVRMSIS
jgi:anti-sigma regulatory factor (Ser/Thr protein kinase)